MPPKFQRWKGIMKCYPFEEKRLAEWNPPYICQPKYDGVRCRAIRVYNETLNIKPQYIKQIVSQISGQNNG